MQCFCSPPDILVPQLETLFASWQDVQCSLDPTCGPLFSDSACKQAQSIIQVAQLGLISDPPGYALYYKMGVDPDGLPYYHCVRGTNSVEGGIHMVIRRTFGSLRASPELSDALLCNIWHRQNAHVGYFNQTGKHWKNHYDDWKRDEIVELAAEAGRVPSFPIPDVLATRIVTDETFGTIAIPDSLIAQYHLRPSAVAEMSTPHLIDNIPAHLTTKLSTKPLSSYVFLAICQGTMYAVVPIHTTGEYNLFSHLLESGLYFVISNKAPAATNTARLVDFNKLTIKWNETVDEHAAMIPNQTKAERIYYKLPEQLEHHHKLWVQARGTCATLSILQKLEVVSQGFFQIPHMSPMFCLQLCLRQVLQELQELPFHFLQRVPTSVLYLTLICLIHHQQLAQLQLVPHIKQLEKRGLKDNVHLAEIINVTKLQPVLEEEVAVSANALITQL